MDVKTALNDLPPVPQTGRRALMARFSFGDDHARRRGIVLRELARIDPGEAARLARELTLARAVGRVDVMATIARAVPVGVLQTLMGEPDARDANSDGRVRDSGRHARDPVERDANSDGHVRNSGRHARDPVGLDDDSDGWACAHARDPVGLDDEVRANREGILLQACDATAGLIGNALIDDAQTVLNTRRIRDGREIVVDLAGFPFGAGERACPGRELALAIAGAVLEVLRNGRVVTTEVEYEDWPNLRIPARLEVEFA